MDGSSELGIKIAEFGWQIFASIVAVAYHFITINRKATKTEIDALVKALASEKEARQEETSRLRERINNLEMQFQHLPDKDDFHKLQLTMSEMVGKMNTLNQGQVTVSNTVKMLDKVVRGLS